MYSILSQAQAPSHELLASLPPDAILQLDQQSQGFLLRSSQLSAPPLDMSRFDMKAYLWSQFFDWRYLFREYQEFILEQTAVGFLRRWPRFDPTPREPDEPIGSGYQPTHRLRHMVIRIHALFHIWDAECDAQLRADLGENYEEFSHLDPSTSGYQSATTR